LLDPNLHNLEAMAEALGPLLPEVVLVGGCAMGLLVTDAASVRIRATIDVDMIIEVATLVEYYHFAERLKAQGFTESGTDIICGWTKPPGLLLDVMPLDENILGFTNPWYGLAIKTAETTTLSNGLELRHVSAPLFLATKLESFEARGRSDYSHHDMEDIVTLMDGRPELSVEVETAPESVRDFLRDSFDYLLSQPAFEQSLPGHVLPSMQARIPLIYERLRAIAGL
jgi:hypothetical protein